jgi:hypothetical protein
MAHSTPVTSAQLTAAGIPANETTKLTAATAPQARVAYPKILVEVGSSAGGVFVPVGPATMLTGFGAETASICRHSKFMSNVLFSLADAVIEIKRSGPPPFSISHHGHARDPVFTNL